MAFPLLLNGTSHEIQIIRRRPHLVLRIDGRDHIVQETGEPGDGELALTIDGRRVTVMRAAGDGVQDVRCDGRTHVVRLVGDSDAADADGGLSELRAPMPGAVIQIHAAPGQRVGRGDPLLTIESMKLQTVLSAPRDGTVAEIAVAQDETFGKDQILARLAPESAPESEDESDA